MSEQTVAPARPEVWRRWQPYHDAVLGFRNYWYPAIWEHEVSEQPSVVTLLGERILVRRVNGRVYAIEDRCVHRRVPLSAKIECYTPSTITCWYHGFTYDFRTGKLVTVLTEPNCPMVGKLGVKTYPVEVAQGIVFLFVGDGVPPPLAHDVPPGFLDGNRAVRGLRRTVNSNWRWGCENGFDTTHIYIHRESKMVQQTNALLPLGFVPADNLSIDLIEDREPRGVLDKLAGNYQPVFQAQVEDVTVSALMKENGGGGFASSVSIWLPGALRVETSPMPGSNQYEWYVPIDEKSHMYWQALGKSVGSQEEAAAFRKEVDEKWEHVLLRGFNDDDIWAREALEDAYTAGNGWNEEHLFRPDVCVVKWRMLASKHNRGLQRR